MELQASEFVGELGLSPCGVVEVGDSGYVSERASDSGLESNEEGLEQSLGDDSCEVGHVLDD